MLQTFINKRIFLFGTVTTIEKKDRSQISFYYSPDCTCATDSPEKNCIRLILNQFYGDLQEKQPFSFFVTLTQILPSECKPTIVATYCSTDKNTPDILTQADLCSLLFIRSDRLNSLLETTFSCIPISVRGFYGSNLIKGTLSVPSHFTFTPLLPESDCNQDRLDITIPSELEAQFEDYVNQNKAHAVEFIVRITGRNSDT